MPSKCWSCTREENGEIINTLCSDDNMKVAECATGSVGCVESLMTFGPLKHDLRHCLVPANENPSIVTPRDLIPIDAYDDEIYAKGCMKVYDFKILTCQYHHGTFPFAQYYTPPSTQVDICICDEDECNKDCDCEYECDNVGSTPIPPDSGGASSIAATVFTTFLAFAAVFV